MDQDFHSRGMSNNETVHVTTVASELEQIRATSPSINDAALQTSTIISSYAAMVDPEEGTSLNFAHSQMVNGVKCAKIEPQDVQSEIEFIGVNPPLEVIEGFVRRIWQAFEIDKICLVRKGVFLNINDHFTMVQRGVYFFDNKPFLIKPWNEEMDINTEILVTLSVWGSESLSKLGSMLGVPIKTDKYTRDKAFLRYAKLLIKIRLQDSFPDFIDFVNKHNVAVRQKVEYDWKPTKCTYCKMPIIRQDPPPPAPSQPTIDAEGFIQVRRKVVASVYKEQSAPTQLQNSFDNLTEGEDPKTMHPSTEGGGLPQWKGSNIRGFNWPNKQEDVKIFLHEKQIGLVGLLETEVKAEKGSMIAILITFSMGGIGTIISPPTLEEEYGLHGGQGAIILTQSDQFIHCKATQNNTMKTFFITFVYGANHEAQRAPLWEDLIHIAKEMDEAWCVLGDFNAVLYPGDRMGGTDVQFHEIKNFSDCIITCELSNGPYYTYTNKTIWTRIDRVLVNTYWYNTFDICQLNYMANSLSDHTAMVLSFPWYPKPKPSFQFCDMWIRDPSFLPLMSSITTNLVSHDPSTKLKMLLQNAKTALQKLNKDKYADLKTQLSKARAGLEKAQLLLSNSPGNFDLIHLVEMTRAHYIQILSSVIDIIKQQS
ncbi:LOW QUALITY PROTEIN: hypothetical protein Cgig2_029905 [Carnegiea gigantea]|uniref:Endonuclease/exonuclease/phosphatase domain-containing protein n=1 Tax=Carnegiea gigantea TaxID=171969 RepID=A0A9Q1KJK3_9CARY|nr:LOW QUALITY PROTEIN: hypothetical protein Cgig2_029905 [Carnegiea gigantea]